jgi:nicotinate dehydrogenase subunit A
MRFELSVNGRAQAVDVPANANLLGVLRDDLGLTGTRYGCGLGQCGSCNVLVDGSVVAACQVTVASVAARRIVTVEGLAADGRLHPLQRAFVDEDALQCGYCTSGMLISAAALLARAPSPTDDQIREALNTNLCRCGVHARIVRAVQRAAAEVAK